MSSSIARTAPARARRSARSVMLSPGPANIDEGSVSGDTDPGAPDVYLVPERRAPSGRVRGVEAGHRSAVSDQQVQVLANRDHRRTHGHVGTPCPHRGRSIGVDDEGRSSGAQREDRPAVGVVAALRRRHQKTGVEGGNEGAGCAAVDGCGVGERSASGDDAPGVQGRPEQLGVHPGHPDDVAGVDRIGTQRGLVDGGDSADQSSGRRPLPFTGYRRAGDGHDRGRRGKMRRTGAHHHRSPLGQPDGTGRGLSSPGRRVVGVPLVFDPVHRGGPAVPSGPLGEAGTHRGAE